MTESSRLTLRWAVAAILAVLLVATGAVASYLLTRPSQRPTPLTKDTSDDPTMPTTHGAGHAVPASPGAPTPAPGATLPDVTVTLTKDAVERAGVRVTAVTTANGTATMRIPGVVEPNAYKQVVVTPLVAGRITRVLVELGQHVKRGETMAQIFSPELAEAQTKFISARAELEAHERELRRTEKLVEIGAASRQELERIHAEHTAQTAEVRSARSRLELLGVPPAALDGPASGKLGAGTNVAAPIAGVVTERQASVGLNVDTASKLFTVVDLSTVWVVADVYEKDFSRVRVGSPVTITTTAYPDLVLQGRVSYIDPQVNADTRTAKARVEVKNARNELRLGMYVDVLVAGGDITGGTIILRSAVQNVGDRQVVYLVNPKEPGKFTEREVRLGQPSGEQIEVLSGVQPGDVIVTQGSFFVRAERERLGVRPAVAAPAAAGSSGQTETTRGEAGANVQTAKVIVGEQGYDPAKVSLRAGTPARITFVRTTDKTCGTEVAFPSLNTKRTLPLNEPVVVEFTPTKTGEIAFVCGMNMLRGRVVVQ